MKIRLLTSSIIFFLFTMGIAQSQSPALVQATPTDQQAILSLVDRFNNAFNAHDPKSFVRVFAEDTDVTNWLGKTVHGRAGLLELMTFVFQKLHPVTKQTLEPASIRFLSPTIAQVDIRALNEGARTPDGKPDPVGHYLLNWTVMNENGEWLIKIFHNTRLPDGMASNPAAPKK